MSFEEIRMQDYLQEINLGIGRSESFLIDDENIKNTSRGNCNYSSPVCHSKSTIFNDINELSIDFLNLLDEESRAKMEGFKFNKYLKLTDSEFKIIRESPLFNFWDNETFERLVNDDSIEIKKCKQVNLISIQRSLNNTVKVILFVIV